LGNEMSHLPGLKVVLVGSKQANYELQSN